MQVFSDGSTNSAVMLIGEAPGKTEIITKKPFTGRSGKLLRSVLLQEANLDTEKGNLYITNIVKFNPENNRTPTKKEMKEGLPLVLNEINQVKPKLIILCGSVAHTSILNTKFENGSISTFSNYQTYSIFHPAYILRNYKKKNLYENTIKNILLML